MSTVTALCAWQPGRCPRIVFCGEHDWQLTSDCQSSGIWPVRCQSQRFMLFILLPFGGLSSFLDSSKAVRSPVKHLTLQATNQQGQMPIDAAKINREMHMVSFLDRKAAKLKPAQAVKPEKTPTGKTVPADDDEASKYL